MPSIACPYENCNKPFVYATRLRRHYKTHFKFESPAICEFCNRHCKNQASLKQHCKRYHPKYKRISSSATSTASNNHLNNNATVTEGKKSKVQHICEFCGKVADSPHSLKTHIMYKHVDPSNYEHACPEPNCGKRFYMKVTLEQHILRHKGIKNFECPHCDKRFVCNDDRNKHINNIHLKIRKYSCPQCPATFTNSEGAKVHFRSLHELARDYVCQYCEKTFTKRSALKKHEMIHTGERPHECPECGKAFIQRVSVKAHRKIHYPDGAEIPPLPIKPSKALIMNRNLNSNDKQNVTI